MRCECPRIERGFYLGIVIHFEECSEHEERECLACIILPLLEHDEIPEAAG